MWGKGLIVLFCSEAINWGIANEFHASFHIHSIPCGFNFNVRSINNGIYTFHKKKIMISA